ncbi:MAG: hypothetical protein J4415_01925 [Candidatus Diapherotrites archaeon]|uniref:Uncharacterized protein n=1 Tax=Candidatus Iainarchaeum sp. TaxID=3101447 RepID=A0A8T4KQR1_9ARCH|nr:hypothetical protein [Candidatus Diapherotrites archaeon]
MPLGKDKMDYGKFFLIVVLVALIIALASGMWAVLNPANNQDDYQKALSAENPEDICIAPSGYTQEQWEEHMGHHPDRYAQCPDSGS